MIYNFRGDNMRKLLFLLSLLMVSTSVNAQMQSRTGKLDYHRSTAGTSASEVIADNLVKKTVYGWLLCHDVDSPAAYLLFSENADPAVDGRKLAPGECFNCVWCGGGPLRRMNLKAQAAGAGYSLIQQLP